MYLGFDSRWPCLKYLQYLNFYAAIAGMVSLGGSLIFQLNLFEGSRNVEISAAVDALASQGDVETRGAIFTREEVVDFILDLVGYNDDQNLFMKRILEPSFGGGDFIFRIMERLFRSWRSTKPSENVVDVLGDAIRGFEIHRDTFLATHRAVMSRIENEGFSSSTAKCLADRWLSNDDFLLAPHCGKFEFVVGNPPYVRQELIPNLLLKEYRTRYHTMYDRADIYIPFIEHSLSLLTRKGSLGFICSDRWMKNRYGTLLRKLIADRFNLKFYVDMVGTQAFQSSVVAYPAITVISREKQVATRVAQRPCISRAELRSLASELTAKRLLKESVYHVRELSHITKGGEPWLFESADKTALVRRLERSYPTLEEAGCKVGIGVATGADKSFIGRFDDLDVEPDRKLPLVMTQDIASGEVKWRGLGLVNPFNDSGTLVNFQKYPRLSRYLQERKEVLVRRHCAQKNPTKWYKTIDKIVPSLASQEKLLIPDIKGNAHVVYEQGSLYPHHNLYYVISCTWDIRALQAVLLSGVAKLFVEVYSTKMRGGFLRFQAQYLRRIRIPFWEDVSLGLREELIVAAKSRNLEACNAAAYRLYALTGEERAAIEGLG